jgi:hypothetical protein
MEFEDDEIQKSRKSGKSPNFERTQTSHCWRRSRKLMPMRAWCSLVGTISAFATDCRDTSRQNKIYKNYLKSGIF